MEWYFIQLHNLHWPKLCFNFHKELTKLRWTATMNYLILDCYSCGLSWVAVDSVLWLTQVAADSILRLTQVLVAGFELWLASSCSGNFSVAGSSSNDWNLLVTDLFLNILIKFKDLFCKKYIIFIIRFLAADFSYRWFSLCLVLEELCIVFVCHLS